jgi:hypothetical protein
MSLRYPLIYGVIAGLIITALTFLIFFTGLFGHIQSPLLGYLVMLVGLTMIFVGIKRFRDMECGGVIRFGRALLLGLGIGVVASIIYVLAFELYVATVGAALVQDIEAMMPGYSNPFYRMSITFLEILPPMLVVALLSAAILRNPRVLPARTA